MSLAALFESRGCEFVLLLFNKNEDYKWLRPNQRKLLMLLKDGPLGVKKTESEEQIGVHRGQAVIGELRAAGFSIAREPRFQGEVYVLTGEPSEPPVRTNKTLQDLYYSTQHWKAKAKERKEIDSWACKQCDYRANLETHHWVYNLFGEDARSELLTLCRDCHQRLHRWMKGSSIHFPRFVSPAMAERIKGEGCES